MRKIRVYIDTSVYGGIGDRQFADASQRFFAHVAQGKYIVLLSETVYAELGKAPDEVRGILDAIDSDMLEEVAIDAEVEQLADAYVAAGALGAASRVDALHIAAATIGGADLVLSWNFKHIVNYERIRVFNSVNLLHGYRPIDIRSPLEMNDVD